MKKSLMVTNSHLQDREKLLAAIERSVKSSSAISPINLDFWSEYLYFALIGNKPKTRIFGVYSKRSDVQLGVIKWYGPWRQYCFFPASDTLYSRGCLQDINNFLDMLK